MRQKRYEIVERAGGTEPEMPDWAADAQVQLSPGMVMTDHASGERFELIESPRSGGIFDYFPEAHPAVLLAARSRRRTKVGTAIKTPFGVIAVVGVKRPGPPARGAKIRGEDGRAPRDLG